MKWIFIALFSVSASIDASEPLRRTYTVYTWTEEPASRTRSGLPGPQMSMGSHPNSHFPVHPSYSETRRSQVDQQGARVMIHPQIQFQNSGGVQRIPQNSYYQLQTRDYYPHYGYYYQPQGSGSQSRPLHQIRKNRPSNSRVRRRNLLLFGGALNNTVGKDWKHRKKANQALGGGVVANEVLHLIKKNNLFK